MNDNPAVNTYQKALFEQGIPATAFTVGDVQGENERMKELGAAFSMEPTKTTMATVAVFDDTCGNLIQLFQI